MEQEIDDDEIERKAIEEILLETKRASERAKEFGSSGWIKPKIPSTNKNFLRNTLVSTLRHPYSSNKHGSFGKFKDKSPSSISDAKRHDDSVEQCTSKSEGKSSGHKSPSSGKDEQKEHSQKNSKKRHRSSSPVKYIYDAYDYRYGTSCIQLKAEQDLLHSKGHRHDRSFKSSKTKRSQRKKKSSESDESHSRGKRKKKSSKKHKSNHHKEKKHKSKI